MQTKNNKIGNYFCAFGILIGLLAFLPQRAVGYPVFARKFHLPCARCHSLVPRLTPFGYAFYRAGFRLPINPPKSYTLTNMVTFMSEIDATHSRATNSTVIPYENIELATAVESHWALRAEYSISNLAESSSGFGEVWTQYNSSPKATGWSLRVGQFPILDGYQLLGARSITLTDPILFGAFGPLTGAGQGNLSLEDLERGIEAGYTTNNLYVRFSWLNGIDSAGDSSLPNSRLHDIVLQVERIVPETGSSVGGFYYLGKTSFLGFNNHFQRGGLFITYARILEPGDAGIPRYRVELNGGLLWGRDRISSSASATSFGSIIEADLYCHNRTAYALRYDTAHPSEAPGVPTTSALTFAIGHLVSNGARLGIEYRHQYDPNDDAWSVSLWLLY